MALAMQLFDNWLRRLALTIPATISLLFLLLFCDRIFSLMLELDNKWQKPQKLSKTMMNLLISGWKTSVLDNFNLKPLKIIQKSENFG